MNEEMMNTMNEENEVEETKGSGMNPLIAMAIGGGITLAAVGLGKKLKKAIAKRKAAKKAKEDDCVCEECDEDVE